MLSLSTLEAGRLLPAKGDGGPERGHGPCQSFSQALGAVSLVLPLSAEAPGHAELTSHDLTHSPGELPVSA